MVGIIGGGISGLFLLHILRKAGLDAVLYESSDSPGGVMQSRVVEGPNGPVVADLGPQRTRLTSGIAEIVEDTGLTPSLLRAEERVPFTIYWRGRIHPAPLGMGAALTTPLVSWPGKLRALADLVTPAPRPDESVADALTRKLGPEIYSRIAGPILGGLYASNPERMESRHTLLPMLRRSGAKRSLLLGLVRASRLDRIPVVSFAEGMGALPRAIAARHAAHLRLGQPARSVVAEAGGGLRIVSDRGDERVDAVVLTLPAPGAARLLTESAPDAAAVLGGLRYNPLAVVPLVVPAGTPSPEMGSGYKMTLEEPEPRATRGVTAQGALFGRRGLFTAFLGGMGSEDLMDRSDEEIMAVARADFAAITGVDAVPLLAHRTAMPAWDLSWPSATGLDLPRGVYICAAYADRPGIPGRLEDARKMVARLTR